MPLNLLGNYNPVTNTPPLSDGTGTAGDMYYITESGTRDLGSGPIKFNAGYSVIYLASGVWFQQIVAYDLDLAAVYGSGGGGGFANPMTTLGDMIAGTTSGTAIRLPIGSAGQFLKVVGGVPTWATLSIGLITLNGDNTSAQTLSSGTTGTDFNIVDNGIGDHKFNIPTSSAINRGLLSPSDWSLFNSKQPVLYGVGILYQSSGTTSYISGTSSQFVKGDGSLDSNTYVTSGSTVISVSGTSNRITSTGGVAPVIDIAATYVGQTSIVTLGVVTTGTWSTGAVIGGATVSLGSDATGDIYYRNSGGVLTRLGIGTTGQLLTVSPGGLPQWQTSGSTSFAGMVETIAFEDSGSSISAQTYTLDLYANYGYTINSLNIICASGTATAAVQIGGVNVTSLSAISVSSVISSTNATGANTVVVGNKVTLVITSPSSLVNLQAGIKLTRT